MSVRIPFPVWLSRPVRLVIAVVMVVGMLVVPARPAAAVVQYDVTGSADNGLPGNFRWAVTQANGATEPVAIVFDEGLVVTLMGEVEYTGSENLTIVGNGSTLRGSGGGRLLDVTSATPDVTIQGLTLEDGGANSGGAVRTAGDLTLNDVEVHDNSAALRGGAIEATGSVNVVGSTFTGNTVDFEGGAIWSDADVAVTGSTFTDNRADHTIIQSVGGTIRAGGDVGVADSTITGGWAFTGGGVHGTNLVVTDATVSVNRAGQNGGGLWASQHVTVAGSTLDSNVAGLGGGAIRASGAVVTATGFHDNTSADFAAGMMVFGDAILSDVVFVGNWAQAGSGGAINVESIDVARGEFRGNTAAMDGGAIKAFDFATLVDSSFDGNQSTGGDGGAVSASNAVVRSSHFTGNTSTVDGGGAVRASLSAEVEDSTFDDNDAGGADGGAVFAGTALEMTNSTVTGNAAADGSGVRAGFGATLTHVTIADNAGVSQVVVEGQPLQASASLVVSAAGGGADCTVAVPITSAYSRDQDGTCGFAGLGDSTGALDLAPLADNGGPTPTRLPAADGPAVDAIPAADCFLTSDQVGASRPIGVGCDLGAVEHPEPPTPEVMSEVVRVAGQDRFETAALLSAATFEPGVELVVIATGVDFPDALTGAVAAAVEGGPVLLVRPDSIPEVTAAELDRLAPSRIVVVGGPAAIGTEVEAALAAYTDGQVSRLSGDDRYETAAAISEATFPTGASVVHVATGRNFPDALAGVPAASMADGPLLLVASDAVPEATAAELSRLGPDRIVVLGGGAAVSHEVEDQLAPFAAVGLERLDGDDRHATAVRVSEEAFPAPDVVSTVFVATGQVFPDALTAGAVAGALPAPVLLTPPIALPEAVAAEISRLAPTRVVVMGGNSAVSPGVEDALEALLAG